MREILGEDCAYDPLIDVVKAALREATAQCACRQKTPKRKIERVLSDADRLAGSLESDEEKAAQKETS